MKNNMEKTFMRVDKDLLAKLKAKKIAQRESYSDVVKRMIDNEVRLKPLQKKKLTKKHMDRIALSNLLNEAYVGKGGF